MRILSERFYAKPHPIVRQLRAEVPWHVVILVAVKLTLEVFERGTDFVWHERQEAAHECPHNKVIQYLRLSGSSHDRNLMYQFKISYFDGRVVINTIVWKHVLNRRVDWQRVSASLHIVESENFAHRALLSRRFHRSHDTSLKTEQVVNKTFSLWVCAGLQAVVNIADQFFVGDDDLKTKW